MKDRLNKALQELRDLNSAIVEVNKLCVKLINNVSQMEIDVQTAKDRIIEITKELENE